jgi:cytidylate kinase
MSVITISRGSYSRGKEVAEKLALKLGYECISREVLLEASDEFNTPEIKLIRALHDPASVLDRFQHGKERYVNYLRAALLQHVRKDNVIYHGLAGHFFLGGIPHVLKVRIIADMRTRVHEEMKRENISEEKALYILQKDDDERRKWGLQLYGKDPWDSRLYDIVVHIDRLTVDDAVDILSNTVDKSNYHSTEKSLKMVDDLALAATVEAHLIQMKPKIEVTADNGKVFIHELDENHILKNRDRMTEVAMQIKGVNEVVFVTKMPREQHGHVNPFQNIG